MIGLREMGASHWKQMLLGSGTGDAEARASALRGAVVSAPSRAEALEALAELAGDTTLKPFDRVVALLAVSTAAAVTGLPLPDAAFAAVEDSALIDEALRRGSSGAVTGVLGRAPAGDDYRALRQLVARRLLAAGERGMHVTSLLIDAGDYARAVDAAVDDFVDNVQSAGDPLLGQAWAAQSIRWMADHEEEVFAPLVAALAARQPGAPAALADLIARARGVDPALAGAAIGTLRRQGERN